MIGAKIKELRRLKGIVSTKLANDIGKSKAYISQIENGRNKNPDRAMLIKIFKVLEVDNKEIDKILDQYKIKENIKKEVDVINLMTDNLLTQDWLLHKQTEDAEKLYNIIKNLPKETIIILLDKLKSENLI